MNSNLTPNAIYRLVHNNEAEVNSGFHPTVQVIKVIPVGPKPNAVSNENKGADESKKLKPPGNRYRVSALMMMLLFV